MKILAKEAFGKRSAMKLHLDQTFSRIFKTLPKNCSDEHNKMNSNIFP